MIHIRLLHICIKVPVPFGFWLLLGEKSYFSQLGLFGENNIKTRTVEILSELLNSEKVKELKKVLISYNENAQDSASGMLDMFSGGIKSKEEILEEIIKQIEDNEQRTRPKQSITVSDGNKRKPDSRTTDGGQSTDDGRRSEEASQRTGSADAERNNEEIKSKPTFLDAIKTLYENGWKMFRYIV